jgi:hypothetical protein
MHAVGLVCSRFRLIEKSDISSRMSWRTSLVESMVGGMVEMV